MSSLLADAANLVMPIKASSFAGEIDWLMWFNFWMCIVFGVLIFVGTAYLGWRYRHQPGKNDVGRGPTHSNLLEIVWSVIPLIIVLLVAIWGFQGYLRLAVIPPANAEDTLEIGVEAYKWGWRFVYPNSHAEPTLHVPINTKVRLVESSSDVIHSLYIPQFRIKKDAVPGRFNKQWFEAIIASPIGKNLSRPTADGKGFEDLSWSEPGSFEVNKDLIAKGDKQAIENGRGGFDIFCTEYCGTGHSQMLTKVHVHPTVESYKAWLSAVSDPYRAGADGVQPSAKDVGLKLVNGNGCFACHSINGANGTGPTWKDLYNEPVKFTDGTGIEAADENYIRESILYPAKKLVVGYGPAMPSYAGKFSDRDLLAITAYMKSISSHFKGEPTEFNAPTPEANQDRNTTK